MLLGPPFKVEGEIIVDGEGVLFVADIVVVAEKRTDALLHLALAAPAHVEPVADKGVKALRLHQIDRIRSKRVILGNAGGALQILRAGGPVLA